MADGKIKISELSEALQINNDAVFPYSQDNGGTDATFGASMTQLARKVTEGVDFTNLETSNKKIVGAINQTLNNFAEEYDTTATYNTGDPTLYNGTLYKCKANNVTGAWDSSKWEEAKAVDFGSGGGGGSGGHTILDDSGTSLTQRTNLQFKGAYSEDNSTDDTTEVNVVREMTKAEFDLLSDDEKVGFINITDITGGNDDRFQPEIYSTDEREIGVWIDGKPLYQKVLTNVSITSSKPQVIDNSISYGTLVDYNIVTTSGVGGSIASESGIYATLNISNNALVLDKRQSSDWSGATFDWISVKYTKTTDVAGSGQWTPQGVPAHHYSTDEHIIGTWIDGKTLYEKTVIITNAGKDASYDLGITDFDTCFVCDGSFSDTGVIPYLHGSYPDNSIGGFFDNTGSSLAWAFRSGSQVPATISGFITVRYTKSST